MVYEDILIAVLNGQNCFAEHGRGQIGNKIYCHREYTLGKTSVFTVEAYEAESKRSKILRADQDAWFFTEADVSTHFFAGMMEKPTLLCEFNIVVERIENPKEGRDRRIILQERSTTGERSWTVGDIYEFAEADLKEAISEINDRMVSATQQDL
jgi:hypothetical protein